MTVKDALILWMNDVISDLRTEIDNTIKIKGGGVSSLSDSVRGEVLDIEGGHTIQIHMADYYKYVESGRKPNSKMPPSDKIEGWLKQRPGINAKNILAEIKIKSRKKSKSLPRKNKTLKAISYDQARKTLSFLFARSIGKKGIEARPFINKVLTPQRLQELKDILKEQFAKDFVADFKRV